MYERIIVRPYGDLELFDVLDCSMRNVVETFSTMQQAKQYLEREAREARACPTCED